MSVQAPVVNGFDNTPRFAMSGSWYQGLQEGQRNLFVSRHCYPPALITYSKEWFDTLPEDFLRPCGAEANLRAVHYSKAVR